MAGFFVWPTFFDRPNAVKLCNPCWKRSRQIRTKVVGGGIFYSFFRGNRQPEVASDVIFGVAIDKVGVDAFVKSGDSGSNSSWVKLLRAYNI